MRSCKNMTKCCADADLIVADAVVSTPLICTHERLSSAGVPSACTCMFQAQSSTHRSALITEAIRFAQACSVPVDKTHTLHLPHLAVRSVQIGSNKTNPLLMAPWAQVQRRVYVAFGQVSHECQTFPCTLGWIMRSAAAVLLSDRNGPGGVTAWSVPALGCKQAIRTSYKLKLMQLAAAQALPGNSLANGSSCSASGALLQSGSV